MKNCGKRFHNEVGKFRFLNELIKVVSPKASLELFCVFCMYDSHMLEYFLVIVRQCCVSGDWVRCRLCFLSVCTLFTVPGLSSSRTREEESTRNDVQLDCGVSGRDQNIRCLSDAEETR